MELRIYRVEKGTEQTTGTFYLVDGNRPLLSGYTMELPWRDNRRRISCIPEGQYKAVKHVSPKFGECLWIKDVPNRSEILVHKGNYNKDTLGCVLLGAKLKDINKDGLKDVTSSANTIKKVLDLIEGEEIDVEII